jgi:hypothetical protein
MNVKRRAAAANTLAAMFLFTLALTFALTLGCSEETTEPRPATERIYGTVTSAGQPLAVRVGIRNVRVDPRDPEVNIRVRVDSTGSFSTSVPPGRYVASIEGGAAVYGFIYQGSISTDRADTIEVAEGSAPSRVDVALATTRLRVHAPGLEGVRGYAFFLDESGPPHAYSPGEIVGGVFETVTKGLPAATYKVGLDLGNWVWLAWTYESAEAERIDVLDVDREILIERTLPQPGTLRVRIRGSWQTLDLSPPRLTLLGEDSTEVASGICDANGESSLPLWAPVRGKLRIDIGSLSRWDGGPTYDEATEYAIVPGETVEVDIVESGIAGMTDRSPVGYYNPTVSIVDEDERWFGYTVVTESGLFRFANLLPGTYYLHFNESESWIPQWYGGSESFAEAVPITVSEPGELVWLDVDLVEGGSISGAVLDPQGTPLRGIETFVTPAGTAPEDSRGDDTTRGPDGAFHIRDLPDGSYKLGARSASRDTIWYPGVASWSSAAVIVLEGHPDLSGYTIQFP